MGIRISSEEAALADQRLDAFAASANRADAAADNLAGGARSASTALATMNSAVRQQDAVLRTQQAAMRASTLEGLNLTRQFSDIGVSLATGMNPLLVFIQQGPQIADVFQQAAAEGRNFNTVLTGLYARLAPLLVPLAAVGIAAGAAAGAFGLFHRSMSDDAAGDLSKSLNLTKEQLDRLKESGVSTSVTIGDTFKATFQEIGANIVGAMSPVTSWLAETWGVTMDSITDAAVTGSQAVLAFFVGTYRAVMATWRNFPAAFGDMVVQGANAAITALNGLINRAVDGLNWLDAKFAGGQMQVAHFQAVLLQNPVAGAAARDAAETEAIYQKALEDVQGWGDDFAEGVNRRRIANRRKLIEEAAGDPNKGRQGGKSDEERLAEETQRYIQSLKDQAATLGMNAIAAKEYEIAQRAAKAAQIGMNDEVEEAALLIAERRKAVSVRCILVRIAAPTGPICWTDGGIAVFNAGVGLEPYWGEHPTYGLLSSVQGITNGSGDQTTRPDLTLYPKDPAAAAILGSPLIQGSKVQVWTGAIDRVTGLLIGAPKLEFSGQVDQPGVSAGQQFSMTMRLITDGSLQKEANADYRQNHAAHTRAWPGENGYLNVSNAVQAARTMEWRT
ncbi:phage tail length tape measure family protein [uncultured Brevundimonas sp.]|uniref:phage tail length tape measure family protein n=1 Tax=uncultured Brevundimonas sp. TaxID=213418 RepID=UPI0025F632B8|nr:phage tail length tape measure family protein [uncultured Brevundimonas sp.]